MDFIQHKYMVQIVISVGEFLACFMAIIIMCALLAAEFDND